MCTKRYPTRRVESHRLRESYVCGSAEECYIDAAAFRCRMDSCPASVHDTSWISVVAVADSGVPMQTQDVSLHRRRIIPEIVCAVQHVGSSAAASCFAGSSCLSWCRMCLQARKCLNVGADLSEWTCSISSWRLFGIRGTRYFPSTVRLCFTAPCMNKNWPFCKIQGCEVCCWFIVLAPGMDTARE